MWTLRRETVLLVFLTTAFLLTGCRGMKQRKAIAGTYVNEENSGAYIELRANGTFFMQTRVGVGWTGRYELDGDKVTIAIPSGVAEQGTLDGSVITDNQGRRWVKH